MNRVSKRVMKIQLDSAEAAVIRNLDLAEDNPQHEGQFLKKAVEADEECRKLKAQLA